MDDLERRKVLNRLTKSALVDLVLIQLQPGFNQNLTLDNLLYDSLLRMKQEEIEKVEISIAIVRWNGMNIEWLDLHDKLDKLLVEHDKLMDLAYPKHKGVSND